MFCNIQATCSERSLSPASSGAIACSSRSARNWSATLAGVICPGGPITIFPIAAAFVAIGADTGAAIAFITSWTLLGYARILVWELPFFGIDFVIWRTIISIPLPIIAGLLARFIAGFYARGKGGE